MTELEKARLIINEVDAEMAELFVRRMDAVKMVAAYKKERGLQVTDPEREEAIIRRNAERVKNEEYRSYFVSFLHHNMELSKNMQHRMLDGIRIAYSGVEGAFANIAAKRIFPDGICISHPDFTAAYDAVVNGECDCAVLPLENSFNGDVGQVMDLAFGGPLYINGMYDVPIVHHLLAVKGTTMDEVKTVISHPQALGQCAAYIRSHGFETMESVNTAVAVKQVAEMGSHELAAIGSEEAAEKYGLKKLEAHINESGTNTTRFAVFSRVRGNLQSGGRFILVFTVRNEVGSLGRAVSVIGAHGFNMRALKSRPTKDLVWSYYFFAEGEGDIASTEGTAMLDELRQCCDTVRVIGSYDKEIDI